MVVPPDLMAPVRSFAVFRPPEHERVLRAAVLAPLEVVHDDAVTSRPARHDVRRPGDAVLRREKTHLREEDVFARAMRSREVLELRPLPLERPRVILQRRTRVFILSLLLGHLRRRLPGDVKAFEQRVHARSRRGFLARVSRPHRLDLFARLPAVLHVSPVLRRLPVLVVRVQDRVRVERREARLQEARAADDATRRRDDVVRDFVLLLGRVDAVKAVRPVPVNRVHVRGFVEADVPGRKRAARPCLRGRWRGRVVAQGQIRHLARRVHVVRHVPAPARVEMWAPPGVSESRGRLCASRCLRSRVRRRQRASPRNAAHCVPQSRGARSRVGDGGDLESRSSMTKNKDEIRVVEVRRRRKVLRHGGQIFRNGRRRASERTRACGAAWRRTTRSSARR